MSLNLGRDDEGDGALVEDLFAEGENAYAAGISCEVVIGATINETAAGDISLLRSIS